MPEHRRSAYQAVVLAMALVLLVPGLGNVGLTDRDEGSNAEAAREMVETGDWVSPTLDYKPRFAKPALIYWLMSGAYVGLGVSEFTARLPSAVFAVLLILLQYRFLMRVRGPEVALLGAIMLLLNPEIFVLGRMALTDSVLIFFTTLSLYGFWLGIHGEGRERHAIWLLYAGMGLATLTKGPVGLVLPLLAVVPYLTVSRRWRQFWDRGHPVAGLLLCAAIALPWYAAMLALHGSHYLQSARANTVGRFFRAVGGHGGTALFYVPVLLFGFFPWGGFLIVGLYQSLRRARGIRRPDPLQRASPAPDVELDLFAAIWIVAVFVFFSASATRLPHYLAPLFPAAAILAASYWQRCLRVPATPGARAAAHVTAGLGCVMGLALAATPLVYHRYRDVVIQRFPEAVHVTLDFWPVAAGLGLVAGSLLIGWFALSEKRRSLAFPGVASGAALMLFLFSAVALPWFNANFLAAAHELARTAGASAGPEDELVLYGRERPSFIFYARRKALMVRARQEERLREILAGPRRAVILLPLYLLPQLPPETRGFETLRERDGYRLLESRPSAGATP